MEFGDYHLFVTTIEHGSITAAAATLGVSRPTLSRRLSALEDRLGLALLHRTTRQLALTPEGQRLFDRMCPLVHDMARAEAQLLEERDMVSGRLRVSVPPVLAPELIRVLVELQREHPRLEVELIADIRWADLRSDHIDVAVRAGRLHDPDLIQRRLGSGDVSAVASPGYLARNPAPGSLAELSAHRLLRGHSPEGTPQRWWPLRDGGRVPVDGDFASNDQLALLEAALADAGIAMLSEVSSARPIADGRLVRVLPDQLGARLLLHAVYARRTRQPARIRVFVNALLRWFSQREDRFGLGS